MKRNNNVFDQTRYLMSPLFGEGSGWFEVARREKGQRLQRKVTRLAAFETKYVRRREQDLLLCTCNKSQEPTGVALGSASAYTRHCCGCVLVATVLQGISARRVSKQRRDEYLSCNLPCLYHSRRVLVQKIRDFAWMVLVIKKEKCGTKRRTGQI